MTTTFRPTSAARGVASPAVPGDGGGSDNASSLVETILAGVTFREVTIPRTDIKGAMRLLRRAEETQVRVAVRRELEATFGIAVRDINPNVLEGYPEWREAWRLHFIATAVRNAADPAQPLMSIADWGQCDDVQLLALWTQYQELECELDPLGPNPPPLTEQEAGAIRAAAKKGDADLLMSYGSHMLARFAITSVAEPTT